MIKIQLTEENILKCNDRCQEMVDYFNEVGVGEYGHNKPKSTMKGLKGEVAFDQWISDKLPDSLIERSYNDFKNRKAPDFKLGQRITEIKSIDKEYWRDLGRMLPPKQLKAYKRKNALVIWACATAHKEDNEVWLMGWNNAKDFTSFNSKEVVTICNNVHLYREQDMRSMNSLYCLSFDCEDSEKPKEKKEYEKVRLI